MHSTIQDLDTKLHKVVQQQEYDYLQGYNVFVTKKERELRVIIEKLNEKNSNKTLKDEKIVELELMIHKMKAEAFRCEDIKDKKLNEIVKMKDKLEVIQEDRKFLYQHAKEEK